jgi:hypothetical protein
MDVAKLGNIAISKKEEAIPQKLFTPLTVEIRSISSFFRLVIEGLLGDRDSSELFRISRWMRSWAFVKTLVVKC